MVKIKRYAVTLALVLLVAASLGVYYAYGANPRLPEYRLQTLEGDPAEAAGLTLEGSFVGGKGSYMLKVTAEGSETGNGSLWHQLLSSGSMWMRDNYSGIDELFREHKQFMRGKFKPDGFYRDADWLLYADAEVEQSGRRLVWKFDELRLKDDKRIRQESEETELLGEASYANVLDVQKIGGEWHVLARLGWENAVVDYRDEVFDAATGQFVRSVLLDPDLQAAPGAGRSIEVIADATPTAPNPQAVLVVETQSPGAAASSGQNGPAASAVPSDQLPQIADRRVYVYSYETGELKELPVPFKEEDSDPRWMRGFRLEGETLTASRQTDDAFVVTRYDLTNGGGSVEPAAVTIRADQVGESKIGSALYANGRIYLLVRSDDDLAAHPTVAVADAADGRILYKGEPVCVDPNGRPQEQLDDVWLQNLSLRR